MHILSLVKRRKNQSAPSSPAKKQEQTTPSTPLVSVIVPSYNVENYILDCLSSISRQTYRNLEIIVVNDGSTDNTLNVAQGYLTKDSRVQIVNQVNAGLSEARNSGLDRASGRFIMYVDSDDTLPPRAIEAMVDSLESSGSDLAIGRYDRFNSSGHKGSPEWIQEAHESSQSGVTLRSNPSIIANVIAMPKLYRRSFIEAKNLRFVPGILYEDQDYAARAYTSAASIDIVPDIVYNWRVREDTSSISQQTRDPNNAIALLDALASARRIYLEARIKSIARARVVHMIRVDLPPIVSIAANSDPEHQDLVRSRVRELLDGLSLDGWLEAPVVPRIRTYLAWRGDWAGLLDFNELVRTQALPLPVVSTGDGLEVPAGHFPPSLSHLPGWIRRVSEDELTMVVNLSGLEWNAENALEIRGWAFVRGVTTSADAVISAWLVGPRGQTLELPLTRSSSSEPTIWARHRNANYDNAMFTATVSPSLLPRLAHGAWQLMVSIEQDGLTLESPVTHRFRGGTAGYPVASRWSNDSADIYLVPRYESPTGLSLRSRAVRFQAFDFNVASDGRECTCTLVTPDDVTAITGIIAVDRTTKKQIKGSATEVSPGRFGVRIRLPQGSSDSAWEVRVQTPTTKRNLLDWVADTSPSEKPGTSWVRTKNGYAALARRVNALDVADVTVDERNIVVRAYSDLSAEVLGHSELRSGPSTLRAATARVDEGNLIELVFPLEVERFGSVIRPAPSGIYRLSYPTRADGAGRRIALVSTAHISDVYHEWALESLSARSWRVPETGDLRITISAPLTPKEKSRSGQAELEKWYQSQEFTPINGILFQCYRGEIATDSQAVLHRELRRRDAGLQIFWGVSDLSVPIPEGGVKVVIGSKRWYELVGSCRYLCNNIEFDRFFRRRPYQYLFATFHGYPFKAMGRAMWENDGLFEHRISVELERRKAEWCSLVVPSDEAASHYREQYEYDGDIIVSGYPRNDPLINSDRESVRSATLERIGISPEKKVILFAPTWRESLASSAWKARLFDQLDLNRLASALGDQFAVLVRGHNFNARDTARMSSASLTDVTDYPDINELILAADAAILDYSSLRFDWALTGRPAIFFVPDRDEYLSKRPALFDFDETAPGPQVTTTEDVIDLLSDLQALTSDCAPQLASFNERFNRLHDGQATARLIRAIVQRNPQDADLWGEPADPAQGELQSGALLQDTESTH